MVLFLLLDSRGESVPATGSGDFSYPDSNNSRAHLLSGTAAPDP
ncbi:MAG: hypothetical protein ACKPBG_10030 [Actinomycetota bacterium]